MFLEKEGKLIYSYDGETVCIEAWGKDALRVRATKNRSFTGRDWALEAKDAHAGEVEIFEDPSAKGGAFANMYEGTDTSYGKITNGKLHAVIDSGSVITFYHEDGRVLLKEHFRRLRDEESMPLNIMGREYSNGVGDNFRIVIRLGRIDFRFVRRQGRGRNGRRGGLGGRSRGGRRFGPRRGGHGDRGRLRRRRLDGFLRGKGAAGGGFHHFRLIPLDHGL